MELTELQNLWKEYDKKISENTRLNKEILKLMLLSKPQRKLNWIIIKAGLNIFISNSVCSINIGSEHSI